MAAYCIMLVAGSMTIGTGATIGCNRRDNIRIDTGMTQITGVSSGDHTGYMDICHWIGRRMTDSTVHQVGDRH